jgi:hypothetical protein
MPLYALFFALVPLEVSTGCIDMEVRASTWLLRAITIFDRALSDVLWKSVPGDLLHKIRKYVLAEYNGGAHRHLLIHDIKLELQQLR